MKLSFRAMYGLSTVLILFVIISAPANAETLTGCLTPGGTIVSVMVGGSPDTPSGECPPRHHQITWNGDGGPVVTPAFYMNSADFSESIPAFGQQSFSVQCEEPGDKVTGGGYEYATAAGINLIRDLTITASAPLLLSPGPLAEQGWLIQITNTGDQTVDVHIEVTAICRDPG